MPAAAAATQTAVRLCQLRVCFQSATSHARTDEDDTAALLAELERIKAERAEEAARKEAARNAAADIERAAELASGNPLLDLGAGGGGPVDFSRASRLRGACTRLR